MDDVRRDAVLGKCLIGPVAAVVTDEPEIERKKKARSGISPTQRTLRELRGMGRISGIVERFNQHAGPFGIRQDLFGFIDLVALDPERGIVGVQCCAGSGHAAHRRKILEECTQEAVEWLRCGGRIEIWSWSKRKLKRGGKAERWCPRVEEITAEHFQDKGWGCVDCQVETGDAGEG